MLKTGLTLGKYAPFHKGHQFVVETALSEVDDLTVLIYDTPVIEVPLSARANWIRKLYPQVRVIEGWDGPDGYSNERSFEILQENYILSMLDGRRITHFYSGEPYGAHVSRALEAVDRRVSGRLTSGTAIRNDPYGCREQLNPLVYADLITKAVFVGAMSTGKTTLAQALAERFKTEWVREYGRDYWEEHQVDRRINLAAFDEIALGHQALEDEAVCRANRYLFVDTNAITTYMFAMDYHGAAPELLTRLAAENSARYDLFFLCEDDIPYADTWDRSGDQKRHIFHKQTIADLKERCIPYIPLRGPLEERIRKVEEVLGKFSKYANFFGASV